MLCVEMIPLLTYKILIGNFCSTPVENHWSVTTNILESLLILKSCSEMNVMWHSSQFNKSLFSKGEF